MSTQHWRRGAEDWFARLQAPDCGADEREHFARWVAEPANRAAYAEVERVHALAGQLRFDPEIRAAADAARVPPGRRRLRLAAPFAAAAVLVLALGAWLWTPAAVEPVHYATQVGEQMTETLADGTVLVLDTASAVAVRFSHATREVELERGRAEFDIAADPARPFIVRAGEGVIEDVGTRFQVRSDGAGKNVTVTLLEGMVAVSLPAGESGVQTEMLSPGEQVEYSAGGQMQRHESVDLRAAVAWTHGDLVFEGRPLGELLAEMNRYTRTMIKAGDPALESIRISGVFHQGDQESLLLALQAGWSLRSRRDDQGNVVLYRSGGTH